MSKLNLRQHHGIVTGANTDNKAVSQNEVANGIGYKSEITSENLNAFFQRNDTSIDTLVSLIMETIRTDKTDVEPDALTQAIKMHGQSTYYYDDTPMTNMQVGDRFSDYLGNVYQIIAGKIIDGKVYSNDNHYLTIATINDIRTYIYNASIPDGIDYRIGYNYFARKMANAKFQVKKVVGNKQHILWQSVNLRTGNAIDVARNIDERELYKVMRLPIIDNNSRLNLINAMARAFPPGQYQPPLSMQIGHNGTDINTNDGYFNELILSGHNFTFKRNYYPQAIDIKKISLINL